MEIKAKLNGLLKHDKRIGIIVLIGFVGIFLIFLSSVTAKKDEPKKTQSNVTETQTLESYTEALESKLHALVTSIEGVGDAQVMVTFESDAEYVYVNEEKKNSDRTQDTDGENGQKIQEKENVEQTLILVDGESGQEALLKTKLEPKVKGVVIVCTGGDQPSVQQRVTEALTTALNIDYDMVCVTKLT